MMALTIAGRELKTLFLSPLAWSILGVIQIILAYMFLAQIDWFLSMQPRMAGMDDAPGVTDLIVAPLFGNAGVILLLVTPLLTISGSCTPRQRWRRSGMWQDWQVLPSRAAGLACHSS